MVKASFFLILAGFLVSVQTCFAQTIRVSDPRLELRDNIVHITYDILNSTPSDEFTVDLAVTDANGNKINARALSGDIGDKVYGGNYKEIRWDLSADEIEMNARIFVKVHVKAIQPPVPVAVIPEEEETIQETPVEEEPQEETIARDSPSASGGQSFNRTSLIIQSVAFPGLGLSRYTGNPHWIRGVAGYGCLAGAVVMNRMAINTYQEIMELSDFDEKNTLYQKSQTQDQVSEVLAFTALGIWISDMVWTLVGTSDLKKSSLYSERRGLSLNTDIEPITSAPMIGIVYRF